jgi:hypothetical protein
MNFSENVSLSLKEVLTLLQWMKASRSLSIKWFIILLQVDLSEPILSRFDILCVVRDLVDPVQVTTINNSNNVHQDLKFAISHYPPDTLILELDTAHHKLSIYWDTKHFCPPEIQHFLLFMNPL